MSLSPNSSCIESEEIVTNTSIEQKKKSKKYAHKYKYGSRKLRDELRDKCRLRIRDARTESFQKGRFIHQDKKYIMKILREELADLENDLRLQELIFQELITQSEESFIENLAREANYLYALSESNIVFCPICQRSGLKESMKIFRCDCGISFSFNGTMKTFNEKMQLVINQHESQCDEHLKFFIEPNSIYFKSNLSVLCDKCDNIVTF